MSPTPRPTAGCICRSTPGSDTPVHMAIQRVIMENGWEDKEFIKNWVANQWETDSGFGQGTRNTPWQWRTTWGKFQVKGYEGSPKHYKEWVLAQEESKPEVAAKIAGIDPKLIYQAAEMMAKPKANGERVKTSICHREGQLLVQQLSQHRLHRQPGRHPRLRRQARPSHDPSRRPPARRHQRRQVPGLEVSLQGARGAAATAWISIGG